MSARNGRGIALKKHLEKTKVADLKGVYAFWSGDDAPPGQKKQLVSSLAALMEEEGTVYRRVRTLTRKVLDVLLLLLRRDHYASDLPGLFQRLPGEDAIDLEFHEAEAGLKALSRRGFLAEVSESATNGRVVYTVPQELGTLLTSLFREETRTVASVFSLREHAATITATERERLRKSFPKLNGAPHAEDVERIFGADGAPALLDRLTPELRDVFEHARRRYGGVALRSQWSARSELKNVRWDRKSWAAALESAALGTVARLALNSYGIACDDEALVIFTEVIEDLIARESEDAFEHDEVLRSGCDLIADMGHYLEYVRRNPVKVSRKGEVYKAGKRKIQNGFVFRACFLADASRIWDEVHHAADHLALVATGGDGFLELRPEAEAFLKHPLEEKVMELYRVALEQPGSKGRSLHQHELRTVVAQLLREHPQRWWRGRSLAMLARHRYFATLDERGIKDRHRDRFFSAYFSGRETPADLLHELDREWLPRLFIQGLTEAAVKDDQVVAWRLTALGARVFGAEIPELETGLQPVVVNPDFEVMVLPDGDVSDVVHTLDAFARREKSGDVVHFRLTKEAIEAAVGAGRSVRELIDFLEARSKGQVPQNVIYTLNSWAGSVTFATLEHGFVLTADDEAALDRILAFEEISALVKRRLSPSEALLREAPSDRKLLATLRERGIELKGP